MTTSKNFDTQPKMVEFPYFKTFDSLIGFNKRNKKAKFDPALKEEWEIGPDGKGHFVNPSEAKAKKLARAEAMAKGKTIRNLDKEPMRAKPFKNDTFFTVSEIAKYCWEHAPSLHGKFTDRKQFLAKLKEDKAYREHCNAKMIAKLGKNKAALEPKKVELEKDPVKIADYFIAHPKFREWFKDVKSPTDFRRMVSKNPEQAEKLARIMYNEKNSK